MGQKHSVDSILQVPRGPGYVEEERVDTFALWPGLENQLELSFSSLDLDDQGTLPYATLEPVLRHHLMQIGLMEYISRFAKADGSLDESEIMHFLRHAKLDIDNELTLDDWKTFALAWIHRVQDAMHEDIQSWQNSVTAMQESQAREYQMAMKNFQTHYVNQLKNYYEAVDEIHKKEEEYRIEWETSLGLQDEFYNMQMRYLQERNDEAKEYFEKQTKIGTDLRSEYLRHLKTETYKGPGNVSVTTYAYPTDLTMTGAPISGGAQIPSRRVNRSRRVGRCC